MDCKTIADVKVAGHIVLARVDFNVPLDGSRITDDTRIAAALPTINYLRENGAKVILCSHLGRPKGKPDPAQSLAPCAEALAAKLGAPVPFIPDCVGPAVAEAVANMVAGDVILLENTRFYAGEESKDEATMLAFAQELAAPADMFVNDAFGSSHRKHASVYGVTKFLSPCVAGFLVQKEVAALTRLLSAPEAGFVAVLGGAKVADKIGTIRSLLGKVETLLIGGAMSYAFLKAEGYEIGDSLFDPASYEAAADLRNTLGDLVAKKLRTPLDMVVVEVATGAIKVQPWGSIPEGWSGMDIGPQTAASYAETVLQAENVFWNGPMGRFEQKPFDEGTLAIARAMGDCPGFNVVGGGDSVAAVTQMGLADKIDHVSTGGGASLEFIEFGSLPGVEALDKK
ncbi:MAG TPA: phosphoglycerate kinase [Armatimonadota bacterium]|jgi:phosphoglycerate kinase